MPRSTSGPLSWPYSPECVEGAFSEVRRESCNKRALGASRDTYADASRLLAPHRDGGPGIRRARVVALQPRSAFSGSRRGRWEHRRIGGVPYGTLLFLGARFTVRVSGRAARWRGGTTTFYKKIPHSGTRVVDTCITISLRGRAGLLIPLRGTAARPSSCPYSPNHVERLSGKSG